jgi:hypothetical protein
MPDPADRRTARATDPTSLLRFVDGALDDLRLPGGMFVGRRAMADEWDAVVIQIGEDGRHRLPLHAGALEGFLAAAQAHLSDVYGRPVPGCPLHDHALVGRVRDGEAEWVCPEGRWRCGLGEYQERTWPPDVDAGSLAAVLCGRLQRRGIAGWRSLGCVRHGGRWIAEVEIWRMDPAVMDAVTRAAAPLRVEFRPQRGPLPRRVPLHG